MSKGSKSAIAFEILSYLRRHPDAMDCLEGIAQWWVKSDPCLVRDALEKLAYFGMVATLQCASHTFYCSTRREELCIRDLQRATRLNVLRELSEKGSNHGGL